MHYLDFMELETINKKTGEICKSYFKRDSIEAVIPASETDSQIIFNDGTAGGTVYCAGMVSDIMEEFYQQKFTWKNESFRKQLCDKAFINIDKVVLKDLYLYKNNTAFIRYRSIQYFQNYNSYTKLLLDDETILWIHTPDCYNDSILIHQTAEEFKAYLDDIIDYKK